MLSSRLQRKSSRAMVAAFLCLGFASLGSVGRVSAGSLPESGGSSAIGAQSLTQEDVDLVRSFGAYLSTKSGAHVAAIRVPGSEVWAKYFPGLWVGPETETLKTHEMIVVRAVGSVPQNLRRDPPGTTPTLTAMVSLIIDETDGRLVTTTTAPVEHLSAQDNAVFGPTEDVVLN